MKTNWFCEHNFHKYWKGQQRSFVCQRKHCMAIGYDDFHWYVFPWLFRGYDLGKGVMDEH